MSVRSPDGFSCDHTAFATSERLIAGYAHRAADALALACAEVRGASRQPLSPPIRDRLATVSRRLGALAAIQRRLAPPSAAAMDLTTELGRLCRFHTEARFADLGIFVGLRASELTIDASRGWVLLMIVSELLSNAARRAFAGASGRVAIRLLQHDDSIICVVADYGIGAGGEAGSGPSSGAIVAELARAGGIGVARHEQESGSWIELRLAAVSNL